MKEKTKKIYRNFIKESLTGIMNNFMRKLKFKVRTNYMQRYLNMLIRKTKFSNVSIQMNN